MEGRNIVTGNLITGLDSPKHLERAIEFGRRGLESVPPAILRAVQTRREGHEGEWTCDVLEVAEALGFAGGLWSEEEIAQASAIKG